MSESWGRWHLTNNLYTTILANIAYVRKSILGNKYCVIYVLRLAAPKKNLQQLSRTVYYAAPRLLLAKYATATLKADLSLGFYSATKSSILLYPTFSNDLLYRTIANWVNPWLSRTSSSWSNLINFLA